MRNCRARRSKRTRFISQFGFLFVANDGSRQNKTRILFSFLSQYKSNNSNGKEKKKRRDSLNSFSLLFSAGLLFAASAGRSPPETFSFLDCAARLLIYGPAIGKCLRSTSSFYFSMKNIFLIGP